MTAAKLCARCGLNPVGYPGRDGCWDCVPRQRRLPQTCTACGINPVAYLGRATCYACVPRRRRAPLQCKRCGSEDYYTRGLCRRCHRMAPLIDSCQDCLSWGVTRHEKWLCQACRGWRHRYHEGKCLACGRSVVVNARGYCRLCTRVASVINQRNPTHRSIDVAGLNQHGQQLFFADLILKKRRRPPNPTLPRPTPRWPTRYPLEVEPVVLFAHPRRLDDDLVARLGPPPIAELADALHHVVADHAGRHGWSDDQHDNTWRGIRILLTIQDAPGTRIARSDIDLLQQLTHSAVPSVIDVLTTVDMYRDDRPPALETWFTDRTAELPDQMRTELAAWFHVLRDGSTNPPRRKPRHLTTARNYVTTVLPTLTEWAAHGHQSLREITRAHITAALATSTKPHHQLTALRSMFTYLKASKLTFINPTARLRVAAVVPSVPLLANLDPIRDALHSTDTARAALTALIAFHAMRVHDIRQLQLIDIQGRTLTVGDHHLVLADPVRTRLDSWLTERARRWPNSINPHLFIHTRTAGRTTAVTPAWIAIKIGIAPSTIRQDRILDEAFANPADPRRLCDLFGISIATAERYIDATRPTDDAFPDASHHTGS